MPGSLRIYYFLIECLKNEIRLNGNARCFLKSSLQEIPWNVLVI